jgi:carboxyl-terminal processing protease
VNRFSASASEIFAAAMQDYGRALVIGEKTYGKGTVQNMVPISEFVKMNKPLGEVKLTIAKFYRINGSTTQHKGVIPDIEFPGVYDGDEFGEDASPYALPWDQIASTTYEIVGSVKTKLPELKQKHDARMSTSKEYQYLMEDIKNFKEMNDKKYQTLNELQYNAINEAYEKEKKDREVERKARNTTNPDLILDETIEIMLDMKQP